MSVSTPWITSRTTGGGDIRTALRAEITASTIPQIFIGSEHFGGCTDFFDAYKQGRVQAKLQSLGIAWNKNAQLDPYDLLPKWLNRS